MRKLNHKSRFDPFLCLVFCLALALSSAAAQASEWHRVRWVDDGDTVVLSDGRKVRYIGINAPEVAHKETPAERFGPEAWAFNRKLVYQKKVRLEMDQEKQDQYGRVLAYVFLEDRTFVNAELIKAGCAYFVFRRPNTKYDEQLLRLQRKAMAGRVGLWKEIMDQAGPYVANRRSRRFHRRDCPSENKMSPKNRVSFKTKYEAFWEGYSPCKRCTP